MLVVRPLSQAWLTGCFMRSLVLGRVVRFPGWPVFARLAVFYTALVPLTVGLAALARVDGPAAFLALIGVVLLAVPTITADYAIGIDELGIVAALRESVATVRRIRRLPVSQLPQWPVTTIMPRPSARSCSNSS